MKVVVLGDSCVANPGPITQSAAAGRQSNQRPLVTAEFPHT